MLHQDEVFVTGGSGVDLLSPPQNLQAGRLRLLHPRGMVVSSVIISGITMQIS
jgi:hypothetical protein